MNRQQANVLRKQHAGNTAAIERINLMERQERELKTATGPYRDLLKRLIGRTMQELQKSISPHCGE